MTGSGVVLVDTGPLVALFDPDDRDRARCAGVLGALEHDRLVTCEACVTEAMFLLDFSVRAQAALQAFLARGRLEVLALEPTERLAVAARMERYADLPMDYADGVLVVLAERLRAARVFTLDVRDFSVYRVGRRAFEILPSP